MKQNAQKDFTEVFLDNSFYSKDEFFNFKEEGIF